MHDITEMSEDSLDVSQGPFVLACVGHGRGLVLRKWLLVVGCVERMAREGVVQRMVWVAMVGAIMAATEAPFSEWCGWW